MGLDLYPAQHPVQRRWLADRSNYTGSRTASNGSYFGVGANQMSTSFIGLRGKQEIADNLYAVFNLQTLFNPASGMNANGIGARSCRTTD